MAICIAEEAATGSVDPSRVGERFLAWFATHPPDVSNQTRWALSSAKHANELPAVVAGAAPAVAWSHRWQREFDAYSAGRSRGARRR